MLAMRGQMRPLRAFIPSAPSRFSSTLQIPPSVSSLSTHLHSKGFPLAGHYLQTVVWGSSDRFQHTNNVEFCRYFESSRMNYVEMLSENLTDHRRREIVQGTGKGFILAGVDIKYRRPVTYPDQLLICAKVLLPLPKGSDRFTIHSEAYSLKSWEAYLSAKAHGEEKTVREPGPVCVADQLCVSYDYDPAVLSKTPMPEDLRLLLEQQGSSTPEGKENA